MAKIDVVIMSSGRYQYLDQMLRTMRQHVRFGEHDVRFIIHEDKTNKFNISTATNIVQAHGVDEYIHTQQNLGVVWAIKNAWSNTRRDADYIWHQEEDFTYFKDISINDCIAILNSPEHLVSQALLERNKFEGQNHIPLKIAHNFQDVEINGVQACWKSADDHQFFSNNPHLIKKSMVDRVLSEGVKTSEHEIALWMRDQGYKTCYLGGRNEPFMCTHIGIERTGHYHDNDV